MMRLRDLRNAPISAGMRVMVRIDANVQVAHGRVNDGAKLRLESTLPTLQYLKKKRAAMVLVSHRGEPKGRERALTLRPAAKMLSELLGHEVLFVTARPGTQTYRRTVQKLAPGSVAMLENVRFFPGETANDPAFVARLAADMDMFVNDAFASCHRTHASVVGLATHLPAYAGLLVQKEVAALEHVLHPRQPLIVVMGGAKVTDKINTLVALLPKAKKVLLGGGLGNAFLAAKGYSMAKSTPSAEEISIAAKLLQQYPEKIILPQDVGILTANKRAAVVAIDGVPDNARVVDIGPETIAVFASALTTAATVAWNGPLGLFERPPFDRGTLEFAKALARTTPETAYIVVGGGETLMVVARSHVQRAIDHLSTGGGAMLEFLAHGTLPGLVPLMLR